MLRITSGDLTNCDIFGKLGLGAHLRERWYANASLDSSYKQAKRICVNSGFPGVWDGHAWNYCITSVDHYMKGYMERRRQTKINNLRKFTDCGCPPNF